MKQLYFLFFLVFGLNTFAQNPDDIVYIPDVNFKAMLLQTANGAASIEIPVYNPVTYNFEVSSYNSVDLNNDGEIQVSEASLIKYLSIHPENEVSSLEGIESFVNLMYLNCYQNQLTSLDLSQNINLVYLDCSNNQLANLNLEQNSNLFFLNCHFNQLISLVVGQNQSINFMMASDNLLSSIDVSQLPFLKRLDVGSNQLSSIDVSQNLALTYLGLESNNLTNVDVSQNLELERLELSSNEIINLDISQNTNLIVLTLGHNPLEVLNAKNGNYIELYFEDNPTLQYICVEEDIVGFIQNYLDELGYVNCQVNSYCSFTPGGIFYTIQGNNKFDSDNNGCNISDLSFPNQNFIISNGTTSGSFVSDESGNYSIPVQAGNHVITPVLENPDYFNVSPTSATVSFPSATSSFIQDFCITANGVKNDLEVTVIPVGVTRPGFNAEYKIIYKNKGNQVSNGSLSFTFDDAVMDLFSANPVNDASATNSLTWGFTNLNPFETREIDLVFNINSPMETPAVNGGDILVYKANIVGVTDETPNDNTFTLNQTVVNSYDPNDKTCLEGATITPEMVGQYVHYVIRFENTGTYPAQNIVVVDVIDSTKFDISTLIPQRSSHNFYTRINGNKVEFIFENINLPFDDANNDGHVAFKIKTKPTLVLEDTFTNSASIYFDYNFPIVTEPASTTVTALNTNDFDFGNYFTLYPNPVRDILNFEAKNEIGVKSISVYNTLGQIVMAITNVDNLKDIDVSNLTAGSYFVKIYTDKGSPSGKFIKQ